MKKIITLLVLFVSLCSCEKLSLNHQSDLPGQYFLTVVYGDGRVKRLSHLVSIVAVDNTIHLEDDLVQIVTGDFRWKLQEWEPGQTSKKQIDFGTYVSTRYTETSVRDDIAGECRGTTEILESSLRLKTLGNVEVIEGGTITIKAKSVLEEDGLHLINYEVKPFLGEWTVESTYRNPYHKKIEYTLLFEKYK